MTGHYKFCVSLRDVQPLIWRRFMIRTDQNFDDLHYAIQDACGWQDYQIYRFWPAEESNIIARKDDYLLDDSPTPLGICTSLECYFEDNRRCVYEYGHYTWYCDVVLESRESSEENYERRLISGRRAFPLEDCNGRA